MYGLTKPTPITSSPFIHFPPHYFSNISFRRYVVTRNPLTITIKKIVITILKLCFLTYLFTSMYVLVQRRKHRYIIAHRQPKQNLNSYNS